MADMLTCAGNILATAVLCLAFIFYDKLLLMHRQIEAHFFGQPETTPDKE